MGRQLHTVADIKCLGTILSVWAHPDDETYSCAGVMAAAVSNGQTVACVTATKGEAGVQDEKRWPQAQLAEIRANELKIALKILGISDHHWLDYADGKCAEADVSTAADKIVDLLQRYKPDTILTFGPDGVTGHDDHVAISRWVDVATKRVNFAGEILHVVNTVEQYDQYLRAADEKFNIFFNIETPRLIPGNQCDILFQLPTTIRQLKWQALAAMPSQTEGILKHFGEALFHQAFSTETFVTAKTPRDA